MAVSSTAQIPPQIASALQKAAEITGADFQYLVETAARESGFRASVKAPTSSASGLFQFIESTWLQMVKERGGEFGLGDMAKHITKSNGKYFIADAGKRSEILNLRNNPEVAAVMAGVFTQMNAAHLEGTLGRKPTSGELYIAHFLGSSNGGKLVKAADLNPSMKAADLFPSAARANKSLFYRRGKPVSVKGLYQNLVRRHTAIEKNTAIASAAQTLSISPDIKGETIATTKTHKTEWAPKVQRAAVQTNSLFVEGPVFGELVKGSSAQTIKTDSATTVALHRSVEQGAEQSADRGSDRNGQIGVWGQTAEIKEGGALGAEQKALHGAEGRKEQGPILGDRLFGQHKFGQERARGLFVKGGLGRLKG